MANLSIKSGVAILKLNSPPVNGLGHTLRVGLLHGLEKSLASKCSAVVIAGAGKLFSAGADIAEFSRGGHIKSPDLNSIISTMDGFPIPIVAAIHGTALGGGFETALACHWRLGAKSMKIGLPEVHLGLLPGAGGTQRLPRLIGVKEAVEIMTSGRTINSSEALKLGLIDSILASEDTMIEDAVEFAQSDLVLNTPLQERTVSTRPLISSSPEMFDDLRKLIASISKGQVAPHSILSAVEAAVTSSTFSEGMTRERDLFQQLSQGAQAKSLQYFFFSERKCGNIPGLGDTKPASIKSVGIIGGGTMGAGIAMTMANAGINTTLLEASPEKAAESLQKIEKVYKSSSAFKTGKLTEADVVRLTDLITPVSELSAVSSADLVIEAVFEDMNAKKELFKSLDAVCKEGAILATNTSYLDIDEIAGATKRPQSVIGTHFFSPANVMKLLEVVKGSSTSSQAIATCLQLGEKIGKTSVLAGNCFGFIGNRMMMPYSKEAHFLLEEGATPYQIDTVLKERVGLAMGPFEMLDLAGNDVNWRLRMSQGLTGPTGPIQRAGNTVDSRVARAGDLDGEGIRYSTLADKLCEAGWLGQKAGRGWYNYDPANPRRPLISEETLELIAKHRSDTGIIAREISPEEILERCMYSLVNEGFKILEEGIALRAEDIDVVQVYGYGFPKYRGGPMFWSEREVKLHTLLVALKGYQEKFPSSPWWKPSVLLEDVVRSGASLREEMYFRAQKK